MAILINILIIISGICWSIVYVESIHIGFKQKTYAMPLFGNEFADNVRGFPSRILNKNI